MAVCRIRVHAAETATGDPTTILGVSPSGQEVFDDPEFRDYLAAQEVTATPLRKGIAPIGGISIRYIELQPPLKDEQLKELGAICVGGVYEDRRHMGIIDEGVVIDNRTSSPQHYDPQDILAPNYA